MKRSLMHMLNNVYQYTHIFNLFQNKDPYSKCCIYIRIQSKFYSCSMHANFKLNKKKTSLFSNETNLYPQNKKYIFDFLTIKFNIELEDRL